MSSDIEKALEDSLLYGLGFLIEGKHIPYPETLSDPHAQAKAIMDEMTDDERLSLMQEYCVHCGTKHTPCYCMRDD